MAVSCTVLDIFVFEKNCDLEIWVRDSEVTHSNRHWYHSIAYLWLHISVL